MSISLRFGFKKVTEKPLDDLVEEIEWYFAALPQSDIRAAPKLREAQYNSAQANRVEKSTAFAVLFSVNGVRKRWICVFDGWIRTLEKIK